MYDVTVQGLGNVIERLSYRVTAQSCRLLGGRVLRGAHHRAGLAARRFRLRAATAAAVRRDQYVLLRDELLDGRFQLGHVGLRPRSSVDRWHRSVPHRCRLLAGRQAALGDHSQLLDQLYQDRVAHKHVISVSATNTSCTLFSCRFLFSIFIIVTVITIIFKAKFIIDEARWRTATDRRIECPKSRSHVISISVSKYRGEVFYCRRTYVVWQSFQKIGAETAEKECLEKKTRRKV